MPYIIDGHNLIPKIPGLGLEAVDDEQQLLEMVQEFCRIQRKKAEVFFDNAPPGGARARNLGWVTSRFVRQGSTADQAIAERLRRLGGAARNWTVVSSDLGVQLAARAARARHLSSEVFAGMVMQSMTEGDGASEGSEKEGLSGDELDEWMRLFGMTDEKTT